MKLRIQPTEGWANAYDVFVDGKQLRNCVKAVTLEMQPNDIPHAKLLLSGDLERIDCEAAVTFITKRTQELEAQVKEQREMLEAAHEVLLAHGQDEVCKIIREYLDK